jgi:hypothetical protein
MARRNKKWEESEFDWFLSSDSLINLLQNIFVAAVAQQCIEEGVNLKVWVETRVYFKILS